MATLIQNITSFYHYVNDDLSDPRVKGLAMTSSPIPLILLLIVYRQFILKWGPAFMKDRQPFNLKYLLVVYNIYQIYKSAMLAWEGIFIVYGSGHYNIACQKIMQTDTSPMEMFVVNRVWQYYMIKIMDLLDTVFFVLRKKNNQITFLHIYHHMGMCILGYMGTKYVPGGHGVMLGTINSLVHTVMYSYYLLALLKPTWVRQWWKKYITQMQIVQFFILITHFGQVLFQPSCEYPKWVSLSILPHNIFILFMFVDFYIKTYMKKRPKKEIENKEK